MTVLTIGGLADAAGVPVETVRYYERRGLLPPPPRTAAGYRQFSESDVWRLGFIRRAKDLGFTLTEVKGLLGTVEDDGADGEQRTADQVRAAAAAKLDEVDEEIASLARRRVRLSLLLEVCDGGDEVGCASLTPSCAEW